MKKIIFIIFVFLFLPNFVSADVIVSGPISSDTTWSPPNVYVIDTSFSVASGTTLTIEPGTIIKAKSTWYGGPSIYGKLVAHGTSESPIIFTSQNGEINGWQGLYFKQGSEGDFDFVDISYAGYGGDGFGNFVGIENDGGVVDIKNSNIHDNFKIINNGGGGLMSVGSGIYNKSGTLSVSDSVIDNNVVGIRIDSGAANISNNIIKNNDDSTGYSRGYGVYAISPEPLTLTNNSFLGNGRTAYIDASKNFTHSGNTSGDKTNRGFEMNGIITNNTTLSGNDLPFIIGSLTINGTLTIEPGTILKMSDYYSSGSITVNGNLIAKGTKDKKIYITSLRDDSVGGDTNGNDSAPAPKNWSSIFIEKGNVEFDNVVVSYGGWNYNGEYLNIAAAIYQRGAIFLVSNSVFEHNSTTDIFQDAGTTTISHSELTNGDYGIWSRGGNITISQSAIHNNTGLAIYNESGIDLGWWWQTKPLQIIDARNNWWGDPSGPNNVYNPNPTGTGDKISSNVDYIPFLTEPPGTTPPPPSTPECCSNVLFLPGFMASDLYVQGTFFENQLWPPTSLLKADIQKLMLDSGGNSITSGIYTKSIMSEAFEFNIYKSFIEKMDTIVANGEIKEWEGFPYDWRKDISKVVNEDTIIKVGNNFENKKLINEAITLAQKSPTGKITIIGHSNGGLVGKYLIKELANQGKANIVDQFIMVATPQIGTPKAIASLLHGDKQEIPPFVGILMNKELAKELGHNMQSAYNLLPTQSYFDLISDPVIKFNDSINQVFNYSVSGFPQFLNTFNDMFNFITSNNRGDISGEPTNIPSILRSDLVGNANTNIDSLANWQIPSNIKVTEIAGWGESTIKGIDYKSKQKNSCSTQGGLYICQPQSLWDRKLLMTNDGDGTVVIPSATNYNTPDEYYLNLFDLNDVRRFNLKHHNILEASQLLETLSKIFTKKLVVLPDFISIQKPVSTNQSLQLSVHSPVSLGVYSNNLYTGPSSTTPTDAFIFIREEIPNSYYLEIGEDKYIGLPKNGNYAVNLQGEGVGTFTFNQEITQGDQIVDSKSFIDIPVIPSIKASLSIDSGILSPSLNLDIDGNGSVDVQIQANNEFDPVVYLTVMKSVIKSFNLKKAQENNLVNKIDNLIKLIQKGKIQKASVKAEVYVKKLNKKFEKLNNDHKNRKNGKLTEEEMQIIIKNLEEFINNLK